MFLHQQGLDTTTPAGKAMFQMLGVFAEFERSIIQERVRAGLLRARREGKQLGRPRIPADLEKRILAALKAPARTEGCARSLLGSELIPERCSASAALSGAEAASPSHSSLGSAVGSICALNEPHNLLRHQTFSTSAAVECYFSLAAGRKVIDLPLACSEAARAAARSHHPSLRRGRRLATPPAGCGGVIVFAQKPATLSNGDHLQVEGVFETATSPRWVHVPQRNAGDENHYSAAVEKREGCNTTRVLQQWPE